MKKLKFRAKIKDSKQLNRWIIGYPVFYPDGSVSIFINYESFEVDTDTISESLQNTAGGKEMFDGDIVKMTFEDDSNNIIAEEINVIYWEESISSFVFAPTMKHRGLTIRDFYRRYKNAKHINFVEILGNRFDNPTLADELYEKVRCNDNNGCTECNC